MTRHSLTQHDSAHWFVGSSDEGYWSFRDFALVAGLTLYGLSMSFMVRANLGLDPWDVLHQALSIRTGLSIGFVTALVGVLVLLAWRPLGIKPGIGTVVNVAVIAVVVDAGLGAIEPPSSLMSRVVMLLGGLALNAVATVLYIGADMGAGPRDGLMTGLVANTGRPVWLVRTGIEGTVLTIGWLLGGSVGVGTLVYAFGIGPLVQLVLRVVPSRVLARSGWAMTVAARPVAQAQPA
ncbi:MAG: YczE/YyaS/YitT family protein [Segniliparus sp.]|uniref:membrane protein YczE n=1 Tax=Segniliparus sp. TaxID=2804064 RepID=UPI003F3B9159